ncbi:MgtC/SapB family protein [Faecalibacter bovis]|uniref:MgtC/SapB family protein n=1 Tax=Faecalibacter bovis TaxID=2898187 RepID=A0ABX7XCC4_9FLAO|nr:MgtC/SapB family protein [Faecalibacter bovis]QTV05548.1 MgtC/SapB family protein [Faecalibacter bovis]
MDWDVIIKNWENEDLIKIILSLFAGLLLGIEREVKDKSAGFKTITIICLGSTLFTILSFKIGAGDSEDATRIASYVVSGIGFLGAGVIFKDGVNVNGLTTAGIIWISAAIGMSFGFGEYLIGIVFLICSFLIIFFGNLISKNFISKTSFKIISIKFNRDNYDFKNHIINDLSEFCLTVNSRSITVNENDITCIIEITYKVNNLELIENYLVTNDKIIEMDF